MPLSKTEFRSGKIPSPPSGAVNPVPAGLDARRDGYAERVECINVNGQVILRDSYARSGADNPVPPSGVPGGPQPRYNPFTDGPPPVDRSTDTFTFNIWFMAAMFLAGTGFGLLVTGVF